MTDFDDDSLWESMEDDLAGVFDNIDTSDAAIEALTAETKAQMDEPTTEETIRAEAEVELQRGQIMRILAADVYRRFFEVEPERVVEVRDWFVSQFEDIDDEDSRLRESLGDNPSALAILKDIGENNINDVLYMATELGEDALELSEFVATSHATKHLEEIKTEQEELLQSREARLSTSASKARGISKMVLGAE